MYTHLHTCTPQRRPGGAAGPAGARAVCRPGRGRRRGGRRRRRGWPRRGGRGAPPPGFHVGAQRRQWLQLSGVQVGRGARRVGRPRRQRAQAGLPGREGKGARPAAAWHEMSAPD
eukprot:234762-Chlamydomonas_euryale.AAC.6